MKIEKIEEGIVKVTTTRVVDDSKKYNLTSLQNEVDAINDYINILQDKIKRQKSIAELQQRLSDLNLIKKELIPQEDEESTPTNPKQPVIKF